MYPVLKINRINCAVRCGCVASHPIRNTSAPVFDLLFVYNLICCRLILTFFNCAYFMIYQMYSSCVFVLIYKNDLFFTYLLTCLYFCDIIIKSYGPLVKRLRLRPLTAATRVRFPYGSPLRNGLKPWVLGHFYFYHNS